MPVAVLIVIVRYDTPLRESRTVRTLGEALARSTHLQQSVAVLVWDNSRTPDVTDELLFPFDYHHAAQNVGVSGAYNFAMEVAEQRSIPWLLLLDQDTDLPPTFLDAMHDYALRLAADERIAVVAPTVLMHGAPVSPKIMSRFGGSTDPAPGTVGSTSKELIVMNSGMLLRASALRRIGGYSMDYWLDFSDRYVCHLLHRHGYQSFLAGDVRIEHDVSLVAGTQSIYRYAVFMGAQDAYFTQFKSIPRNLVLCARLLRGAWQTRKTDPERSRLMWRYVSRRLSRSRARRLADWRSDTAAQRTRASASPST